MRKAYTIELHYDVQSNSIAGGNVLQAAKLCVYVENSDESFDKAINKGMKVEMTLGLGATDLV
ncbi:hypothetical protein [Wolbachia endosymbiont of Atemnus politus]|uniref:hypothetical protein n=1 Tax=Wolbachia endosymbiont of Atemnus politus TaxID=2682840 RepID=UPI0021049014|nr:hypothetical protein [Wolbachia endosymbiont of Atemnus politus]